MKAFLRAWATLGLLLVSGAPAARAEDGSKNTVITPVFSQLVTYRLPSGFQQAYEDANETSYIQESVPQGESVDNWSLMITLTGSKGAVDADDDPLQRRANGLHASFAKACPETLTAVSFGRYEIAGRPGMGLFLGCGRVQTSQGTVSETAVIMIIQGEEDIYTLQWAAHGEPQDSAPEFVAATWKPRIDELAPIRVCDRVEGETAPYPSCIYRK